MQTYLHHFGDMVANKSATVVGLPVDVEVLQHFFQLFCTRPTKFFFLFIMALRSLAASFVCEVLWKEKEQYENRDTRKNKA